jgi:hypothetical protein
LARAAAALAPHSARRQAEATGSAMMAACCLGGEKLVAFLGNCL